MGDAVTPPETLPTSKDHHLFDQTIFGTPKPQASSTVDRRNLHGWTPQHPTPNLSPEANTDVQSPAYLLNAIDGMRQLAGQLEGLDTKCSDSSKMPPPMPNAVGKSTMTAPPQDDRRESIVTESEANSSLGILKLDNMPGFSDTEDIGNASQIFAKYRNETLPHSSYRSLLGKENIETPSDSIKNSGIRATDINGRYSQISAGSKRCDQERPPFSDANQSVSSRRAEDRMSTISSASSINSGRDLKADLRLRMQRALAKRTIDRSTDSIRMSQLSDLLDDSAFSTYSNMPASNYGVQEQNNSLQPYETAPSTPTSSGTPMTEGNSNGRENFPFSFNGSHVGFDSLSESFQPAEAAMARLEQDENSWRKKFEDFPMQKVDHQTSFSASSQAQQYLTQNLELSAFSGIVTGDVTVSSSLMEDAGKRRLSMGEYFGLRTEKLGDVDEIKPDEERPNFGNFITSPPRSRPHPPLVELSKSQVSDVSLDEIPTRDTGLNAATNTSYGETLDFSETEDSFNTTQQSHQSAHLNPTSQSIELMPPPPPRPLPNKVSLQASMKSRPNETYTQRDSMASRLSMSLSLPRDSMRKDVDMDMSSMSMDSAERRVSGVASISHIANLLSEMPGSVSTRYLVDNLMKGCSKSNPADQKTSKSSSPHKTMSLTDLTSTRNAGEVLEKIHHNPSSVEQRVTDWVSNLKATDQDIPAEDNMTTGVRRSNTRPDDQGPMPPPSFRPQRLERRSVDVANGRRSQMEGFKRSKSVTAPVNRAKMPLATSIAYDGDESDTSAKTPTGNVKPLVALQRYHSTPKHYAQKASVFKNHDERNSPRRSLNTSNTENEGRTSVTSQHSDRSSKDGHQSKATVRKSSLNSVSSQSPVGSEHRPQSSCGSASTKNSSRRTDASLVAPLQVDSTHTQLSWASVQPGASVTQTFALRNKAPARVRLLVCSSSASYKLMGERGDVTSELILTLHPEETRRINVVFTPSSVGPVIGKLTIRRISTSESASASSVGDRRLIPLYGYGGLAGLSVEGASKDRWSQLFLNLNVVDSDGRSEISEADITTDMPQMGASFFIRNSGVASAFVSLQVAPEVPFVECGVSVYPTQLTLMPGQIERVAVRFEPSHDVLQWLNSNAEDMQLLANLWLSWSELATWQRIRRVYLKNYSDSKCGPLSTWGKLYSGDLGVAHELQDKKSSENALAQGVRRVKVSVLGEREQLRVFDLDATMVFQQLLANETAMLNSPPVDDRQTNTSLCQDSPLLAVASNYHDLFNGSKTKESPSQYKEAQHTAQLSPDSPKLSEIAAPKLVARNLSQCEETEENDKNSSILTVFSDSYDVEFPPTALNRKSCARIIFKNPSRNKHRISVLGAVDPFSVATPEFDIQGNWYLNMRVFFKPQSTGLTSCRLDVLVDGKHTLYYDLKGLGV